MDSTFLTHLAPDSTLGDLPLDNVRVGGDEPGAVVKRRFEDHKDLAGVLVVRGRTLEGVISRETFLRHMARPFFPEVFTHRPLRLLLELARIEPLRLPHSLSVHEAAHHALQRAREWNNEPLVVDLADGDFRLLSVTSLLLAQSQLLELANGMIRRQKETADAANEAKSRFLANMSHEIRTPMNGIIGLTDLLLESEPDDERREYLVMVKNSADWLVTVINDILDFSKIEAGRLELEELDFPLRQTVSDLIKPLVFRAAGKGLRLDYRIAADVPDRLRGDPIRLRQVLVNLVGNALKFTERGEIGVEIDAEPGDDTDPRLHFRVRDTGIGIAADKVDGIFRAFEQADGSTSRRYGGTGLGLSISARLVEMMQGRIWVDSLPGQGSTFHFTARFAPPSAPAPLPASSAVPAGAGPHESAESRPQAWGLRVLLAEDNRVNQTLAVLLLQKRGHEVTIVDTGRAAVDRLQQETFDVVLMDVQMPIMDGFEATRLVRERESGGPRTPIVAMTAHALKGDRERCLAAGMDSYVSKPITVDRLYQAIEDALSAAAESATPPAAASGLPPPVPPACARTPAPAAVPVPAVVDWSVALAQVGGDERVLREIVGVFLEEEKSVRRRLAEALAASDAGEVHRNAHSLKGTLGLFGAVQASEVAYRLERLGRQASLDHAAATLHELEAELRRIVPELEAYQQTAPNSRPRSSREPREAAQAKTYAAGRGGRCRVLGQGSD